MASKPLDILKKGLAKLKISFKAKKNISKPAIQAGIHFIIGCCQST